MDEARVSQIIAQIQRVAGEAWSKASPEEKEDAIQVATTEIDRICRFKGRRAVPDQQLSWPRVGVTDGDGNPVLGIPRAVKEATYFLAGAYLAGYHIGPDNLDHSKALVANLLLGLRDILDPDNPTQETFPPH